MRRIDMPVAAFMLEVLVAMGIEGGVEMETLSLRAAIVWLAVLCIAGWLTLKWYEYEVRKAKRAAKRSAKREQNSSKLQKFA